MVAWHDRGFASLETLPKWNWFGALASTWLKLVVLESASLSSARLNEEQSAAVPLLVAKKDGIRLRLEICRLLL